ncbi:vegetative cell wall protein gp1-like [Nothobranchius furzeri]|uniref:Vegetative cell wall protein gp1-like n=1 Tax=Nothobranchius furzeri TaxID=105023 RepID=A0A9D2XFL2_NOTFU|nr:vegetative cell wall protein gp1-like [Nothobranchius furzeri]
MERPSIGSSGNTLLWECLLRWLTLSTSRPCSPSAISPQTPPPNLGLGDPLHPPRVRWEVGLGGAAGPLRLCGHQTGCVLPRSWPTALGRNPCPAVTSSPGAAPWLTRTPADVTSSSSVSQPPEGVARTSCGRGTRPEDTPPEVSSHSRGATRGTIRRGRGSRVVPSISEAPAPRASLDPQPPSPVQSAPPSSTGQETDPAANATELAGLQTELIHLGQLLSLQDVQQETLSALVLQEAFQVQSAAPPPVKSAALPSEPPAAPIPVKSVAPPPESPAAPPPVESAALHPELTGALPLVKSAAPPPKPPAAPSPVESASLPAVAPPPEPPVASPSVESVSPPAVASLPESPAAPPPVKSVALPSVKSVAPTTPPPVKSAAPTAPPPVESAAPPAKLHLQSSQHHLLLWFHL